MSTQADTVDVVEAVRAVRRGWRWVAGCTAMGLALAIAVVVLVPPRFDGTASIVVREAGASGPSLLARLSGGALGGASGMLGMGGSVETEVEVLQSREMLGRVSDSLHLQVRVRSPRGLAAQSVVTAVELPGDFERVRYRFVRTPMGYSVRGDSATATAEPGRPVDLGPGSITLAAGNLPSEFELELRDREDAITWLQRRLDVESPAGEVIQATFGGRDSLTAAAVPNVLVHEYVTWRRGTDRGVNRHRVEFLTAQSDTVAAQLSDAERALRRFQEASGVVAPEVMGKIQLERAGELRTEIATLEVERTALARMLADVEQGALTARQLAAYPSLLRSPAINDMLAQISRLETERTALLERRLESDQGVVTIDRSIANLEGQLVPLATAYGASVNRQHAETRKQLEALTAALATMPAVGESATRLQRDVLRLSQIHAALQAQLVEARLAAVGEGGDVRQLDVARPPKEPEFPRPATTLAAGLGGGLVVGMIAALFAALLGRWIEDPRAIERTTGVPALALDGTAPLLVAGAPATPTVLVVPIEEGTSTAGVAQRLARTALARGTQATVLDLSGNLLPVAGAESVAGVIGRLEREHSMVIVQLPGFAHDATVAALSERRAVLLVAPAGRVDRQRLMGAVETLRRLEVPCAGVVLNRTTDVVTVA